MTKTTAYRTVVPAMNQQLKRLLTARLLQRLLFLSNFGVQGMKYLMHPISKLWKKMIRLFMPLLLVHLLGIDRKWTCSSMSLLVQMMSEWHFYTRQFFPNHCIISVRGEPVRNFSWWIQRICNMLSSFYHHCYLSYHLTYNLVCISEKRPPVM